MDSVFKKLVLFFLLEIYFKHSNRQQYYEASSACDDYIKGLDKPCEVCDGQLPSQVFVYCARCGRKL